MKNKFFVLCKFFLKIARETKEILKQMDPSKTNYFQQMKLFLGALLSQFLLTGSYS